MTVSIVHAWELRLRAGRIYVILVPHVQRVIDKLVLCGGKDSRHGEVYFGKQAALLVQQGLALKQPDLVSNPS